MQHSSGNLISGEAQARITTANLAPGGELQINSDVRIVGLDKQNLVGSFRKKAAEWVGLGDQISVEKKGKLPARKRERRLLINCPKKPHQWNGNIEASWNDDHLKWKRLAQEKFAKSLCRSKLRHCTTLEERGGFNYLKCRWNPSPPSTAW